MIFRTHRYDLKFHSYDFLMLITERPEMPLTASFPSIGACTPVDTGEPGAVSTLASSHTSRFPQKN